MNIREAKQEIIHTLRAYHQKDSAGNYIYPRARQRPILLMGPPGIGKTAVMEQIARECQVGLVAYTITHHTRQSAIGLPHIERKTYGGQQMSVTEYTMSEIIASVYDCMERTGKREGILFIDEINCVSETLAPVMLQFLQNKTFGTHKVPDGWLITAAGNPPEYNKSAREFDIVTLDRVRRIDIESDCEVWMEYAWEKEVHPAILSYLSIRPERFYLVENTMDSLSFVTARGWEDLSEILKSYKALKVPVTEGLVRQYLQREEVSREFFVCFQLYEKYGTDYGIHQILEGKLSGKELEEKISMAEKGDFDERFTVVTLTLDGLNQKLSAYVRMEERMVRLHEALKYLKAYLSGEEEEGTFDSFIKKREESLRVKVQAELIPSREREDEEWVIGKLRNYDLELKKEHMRRGMEGFSLIQSLFKEDLQCRKREQDHIQFLLKNGFAFIEKAFQEGQEMVLFVSGLTRNPSAMKFIGSHGCEPYLRYSEKLLYRKQEKLLKEECRKLMEDRILGEEKTDDTIQ